MRGANLYECKNLSRCYISIPPCPCILLSNQPLRAFVCECVPAVCEVYVYLFHSPFHLYEILLRMLRLNALITIYFCFNGKSVCTYIYIYSAVEPYRKYQNEIKGQP